MSLRRDEALAKCQTENKEGGCAEIPCSLELLTKTHYPGQYSALQTEENAYFRPPLNTFAIL